MKHGRIVVLIVFYYFLLSSCSDDAESIPIFCENELADCNELALNNSLNFNIQNSISAVSSCGTRILFGSGFTNKVVLTDENRNELWEYTLPEFINTQTAEIIVEQGIIIIGGQSSILFALSMEGELLWSPDEIIGQMTVASSRDGNMLCVVTHRTDVLRCFNLEGKNIDSHIFDDREWSAWGLKIHDDPLQYFIRTNSDIIILDEDGEEIGFNDVVDGNSLVDLEILSSGNEYVVSYISSGEFLISLYEFPNRLKWTYSDLNSFSFVDIDDKDKIHITNADGTYKQLDKDGVLVNTFPNNGGTSIHVSKNAKTVAIGRLLDTNGEFENTIYEFSCKE